jgi:monoamine oxidase
MATDVLADVDVLVVGAGAAGIAAARALQGQGLRLLLLEARDRPGGRAWTDSESLGSPFDHGATWLHDADHNPLRALAETHGFALIDSDAVRQEITFQGERRLDGPALRAWDAAWRAFEARIHARAAHPGPDIPASEAAPRPGPYEASIAYWQGEIIAAAPLAEISLHDFAATLLPGRNMLPEAGLGTLLAHTAQGLPIAYGAAVTRLAWGGDGVVAEGAFGRIRARGAILTLPTSLIAAEAIRFDPPLPAETLQAASDLPMGAGVKVALRAAGEDRLGLAPFTSIDRVIAPGETMITLRAWPFGRDHLIGHVGGPHAAALDAAGPAALHDAVMAEIVRCFGAEARRAFRPGAVTTTWLRDPWTRGLYTHAKPGAAGARAILARPLTEGRLCFAGEACHPTLAGTVGGAWLSGEAAAATVRRAIA